MNIPIVRMLHRLNLQQYVVCLLSQHVDLDVLQCMDDSDLESFGVRSSAHRQLIISAAANNGEPTPSPSRSKADSVSLDSSPVVSSVAPASPAKRPEIVLSDDEDDLLVAVAAPAKAPLILLDDSDDDLLPPVLAAVPASPGQAPFRKPINLDEDEDDDI
jgi:hypothetical protein